jgi:hypothetical protein
VHVQLTDGLHAHCERARAVGAKIAREPATQPYGDRVYTCLDLEGHPWSFGQTVAAMTTAEMAAATGRKIDENLEGAPHGKVRGLSALRHLPGPEDRDALAAGRLRLRAGDLYRGR